MVATKEASPHVPLSTSEILDDVAACRELGAAIVHVHARDESAAPTHRAEYFAPIIEGIRAIDPELVVCASCSGRFVSDLESRAEVLDLDGDAKPDMASLTLGSNNFRQPRPRHARSRASGSHRSRHLRVSASRSAATPAGWAVDRPPEARARLRRRRSWPPSPPGNGRGSSFGPACPPPVTCGG